MQRYYQPFDTDASAWAGDYPTLDDALSAIREWADHDGDAISDALGLCMWDAIESHLIAVGPPLLVMARSVTAQATT